MDNNQIQLKLSLSPKLNTLLREKADKLGIPSTQLVKYLIIKEVNTQQYPIYEVSEKTQRKAKKALSNISSSKTVDNITTFIKEL